VAGTVAAIGGTVTRFKAGDEVFGISRGSFAEYAAAREDKLVRKPAGLSFEQAAVVAVSGLAALQGLRAGRIAAGQKVLIIGASGGADQVIDYTREDFTAGAAGYDVVFQLGGTYSPAAIKRVLTAHGTLIQSYGDGGRWLGPLPNMIKAAVLNRFTGQTLKAFTATVTAEALNEIKDLIESHRIVPAIGRTFPPTEAAAAVELIEKGSPPGKVVVVVD